MRCQTYHILPSSWHTGRAQFALAVCVSNIIIILIVCPCWLYFFPSFQSYCCAQREKVERGMKISVNDPSHPTNAAQTFLMEREITEKQNFETPVFILGNRYDTFVLCTESESEAQSFKSDIV